MLSLHLKECLLILTVSFGGAELALIDAKSNAIHRSFERYLEALEPVRPDAFEVTNYDTF